MKNQDKFIWVGIAALLGVGSIFLLLNQNKKKQMNYQRAEIADEGYEFAADILFPLKSQRKKAKRRI